MNIILHKKNKYLKDYQKRFIDTKLHFERVSVCKDYRGYGQMDDS